MRVLPFYVILIKSYCVILFMGQTLVPKTVKITLEDVEFLDHMIAMDQWHGYSHCFRWLIEDFRRRHVQHLKGLAVIKAEEVSDGVQGKGEKAVA